MSVPGTSCDLCGEAIPPHAHYLVRIDVLADPSMPAITQDDLDQTDYGLRIDALLRQMEHMSAEQLQDDVHRRFELRVCRRCQRRILADPLGRTRRRKRQHRGRGDG